MYKVFIENQALIFIKENIIQKNKFYFESSMYPSIADLLEQIDANISEIQVIVPEDRTVMFEVKRMFKSYKKIKAAGGIVRNESAILFIFRNGKWDLPKGHIDNGETIKQAAVREVEEECGVVAKVGPKFQTTHHTYFHKDRNVLKTTHWFEMECLNDDRILPQLDEGITSVDWVKSSALAPVFENTYASISELLINYLNYKKVK
jgi:8-oxo-dGTP pyrophosphatase MutT (NUDIX family)